MEAAYGGERYAAYPESTHDMLISLGEAEATRGPDGLRSEVLCLVARLRLQLADADAARPIGVTVMRLDDYVRTRVVELVVHSDDIAASVGAQPTLRAASSREALDVLGEVAASTPSALNAIRAMALPDCVDPSIRGLF